MNDVLADTLGIGWRHACTAFYTCDLCGGDNLELCHYVWWDQKTEKYDLSGAEPVDNGHEWFCRDCEEHPPVTEQMVWMKGGAY